MKEFPQVQSHVKRYHVYKVERIPFTEDVLVTNKEPENMVDKYAVAVI